MDRIFSCQEIRNIRGERNGENENTFQVYYNRKPFRKSESHIGTGYDTFVSETAVNLSPQHEILHSMSQRIRCSMR